MFHPSGDDLMPMWCLLWAACGDDYVCPITLIMAGEAHVTHSQYYNEEVRDFVERHPESIHHYLDVVSVRCNFDKCEYGYCEPGVVHACNKCGVTYCCVRCKEAARDRHVREICRPELKILTSMVFSRNDTQQPKAYFEHVLNMFGIVLPHRHLHGSYQCISTISQ